MSNTNLPQPPLTYRGYEVTLDERAQRYRAVCPWYIPALRRPCRNPQEAAKIIDGYLAHQEERRPDEVQIVAADVRVVHGQTCGAHRRRIEQASARKRTGGKFAGEPAA